MTDPRADGPRILLTGGGTGGHVYPALAIAEAVQRLAPTSEVRYAGTATGIERRLAEAAGLRFHAVAASGMRGLGAAARVRFIVNFARGTASAYRMLGAWRPDVVLGTGGYVTGPVLMAARLRGIACALQEQNAVPGSANRLAARWARRIYLGEASARRWLPAARCELTGNPVRAAFLGEAGPASFPLPAPATTPGLKVLIFGGSGGARTLNRAAMAAAPAWRERDDIALVIQTGRDAHAEVAAAYADAPPARVQVLPYIDTMPAVLRWADLVVGRAGAMTLAELAATGCPAILVPFPHATDNHQLRNAREREAAGAAVVLEDHLCDGPALQRGVADLAGDPARRRAMGEASAALARPQAASEIAAGILRLASAPRTG